LGDKRSVGINIFYFFTFGIILACIIVNQLLKKKYSIKSGMWIYKWVNPLHAITELSVVVILIIIFFFIINTDSIYFMDVPILVILYLAIFSIRALFEWYFEKESKRYILTVNIVVALVIIMGLAVVFII